MVLFVTVLPYVVAVALTYRPKVVPWNLDAVGSVCHAQTVHFDATDGVPLTAWWIPAGPAPPELSPDARDRWGRITVLVCHGFASSKSTQLAMARSLPTGGYNLLALDLRGHGQSGGQLTSFGDAERQDVLGAVRWLKSAHPAESRSVFGVGASTGGAALVAAAADPSADGQALRAVAVVESFDTFPAWLRDVSSDFFVPPLPWLTRHVALPLMELQTGRRLSEFSPADLSKRLAPRPLLVIHGRNDRLVRFQRGQRLLAAANWPKVSLWIDDGDHDALVTANDDAARQLLSFFNVAAESELRDDHAPY